MEKLLRGNCQCQEDLEKNLFKDVLGEYTTSVSGSSVRRNNVRLAGEKCNVILLPGEEFSYNKTVGKRTKENGFGEAGAYLNGETVQEVGGGVHTDLSNRNVRLLFFIII